MPTAGPNTLWAGRTVAGITGTWAILLLQTMFLSGTLWEGESRLPILPDAIGTAANAGEADGNDVDRRIVVRLISDIRPAATAETVSFHLPESLRQSLIEITGPDSLSIPPLVFQDEGNSAERTEAELIARAKLAGLYESQVRARIERAWTLPADVKLDRSFKCAVLIRQHQDGRVHEVELPYECGGSTPLRESLIKAIYTASPLPAPPHPGVFVDNFTLVFNSETAHPK